MLKGKSGFPYPVSSQDPSLSADRNLSEVFFPFIEWIQRVNPLKRGVLTIIRPQGVPPFELHLPPFSVYRVVASFAEGKEEGEDASPTRFLDPQIFSLVHITTGFMLNLLVVSYRLTREIRYGLVLETELRLSGNWWQPVLVQLEERGVIPRLFVSFHPQLSPEPSPPGLLILEAYRTLGQGTQVKFYFREAGNE